MLKLPLSFILLSLILLTGLPAQEIKSSNKWQLKTPLTKIDLQRDVQGNCLIYQYDAKMKNFKVLYQNGKASQRYIEPPQAIFFINEEGTPLSCKINTPSTPQAVPTEFTDTRDGTTYPLVKLGNLLWMTKSLTYGEDNAYPNGSFEIELENGEKSRIHSWMSAYLSAPEGFRLPTREEYEAVAKTHGEEAIKVGGSTGLNFNIENIASCAAKEGDTKAGCVGGAGHYWSATILPDYDGSGKPSYNSHNISADRAFYFAQYDGFLSVDDSISTKKYERLFFVRYVKDIK